MALNSYRLPFGQLQIVPNDQSIIAVLIGLLRSLHEPKFLLFEPNDLPPSDAIIAVLIGLLRGLKPGGIGIVKNGGKMAGFEARLISSLRQAGLPIQEEQSGAPGLGTLLVVHSGGVNLAVLIGLLLPAVQNIKAPRDVSTGKATGRRIHAVIRGLE